MSYLIDTQLNASGYSALSVSGVPISGGYNITGNQSTIPVVSGNNVLLQDNIASLSAIHNYNIQVTTFTLPALTASQRVLVTGYMGNVQNKNSCLCAFFRSGVAATGNIGSGIIMPGSSQFCPIDGSAFAYADAFCDLRGLPLSSMLFLTTNYQTARRFSCNNIQSSNYQSTFSAAAQGWLFEWCASGTVMPQGFTYQSIGAQTLIGYMASYGGTYGNYCGTFGSLVQKNIVLESAWVDGTGNAIFAFTNKSASTSAATNFYLAFYE